MKIIVASDIFGDTPALRSIAQQMCNDFLVVSPYSSAGQPFTAEAQAYAAFLASGGIPSYVEKLASQLEIHRPDALVGFSAGATAGWIVLSEAMQGPIQLGILFYGSRIRAYTHLRPCCPVRLFFAEYEPSVDARQLVAALRARDIAADICRGCRHGFMNPLSPGYDPEACQTGVALACSALDGIVAP
jgi:dienelactone hydrolase